MQIHKICRYVVTPLLSVEVGTFECRKCLQTVWSRSTLISCCTQTMNDRNSWFSPACRGHIVDTNFLAVIVFRRKYYRSAIKFPRKSTRRDNISERSNFLWHRNCVPTLTYVCSQAKASHWSQTCFYNTISLQLSKYHGSFVFWFSLNGREPVS